MRFENLKQVAKGINGLTDGVLRDHALAQIEGAKWRFWNGYTERGIIGLVYPDRRVALSVGGATKYKLIHACLY
jgi:hypothetical protein